MGKAVEITDANFEEMVMKSDKPVVLDFWATWCGPCKLISPVIDELAGDFEGKALVGKIDVSKNPKTTVHFKVKNIPTVLFLQNGVVVDKVLGPTDKKSFADILNKMM